MKFAITLIKFFSGLLSAVILGAFVYYLQLYIQTKDNANLVISNITFVLFIISSIVFALVFMAYDAYRNKNSGENLVKDIMNNIKNFNHTADTDSLSTIIASLQKLSSSNNDNNNFLVEKIKSLSEQLQSLNSSVTTSSEQQKSTSQSLTSLQEQISTNIANIQQDKTPETINDLENKLDALIQNISNLSTDVNNLNSRTLDIIHEINKNVNEINNNQKIIKSISEKINLLHPELNDGDTSSAFIDDNENLQNTDEKISVADFYEQQINNKTDETPVFENNFTDSVINAAPEINLEGNNEPFIEEPVSFEVETPVFESDFAEPVINAEPEINLKENNEPFMEEPVSLEAETPVFENNFTEPVINTEPEINLEENNEPFMEEPISVNSFLYDTSGDFQESSIKLEPITEFDTSETPISLSDILQVPENTPIEQDIHTSEIHENSIEAIKEEIKDMPIYDPEKALIATDNPALLASDDPFGSALSNEIPMYDPTIPVEEKIDLSFDDAQQFGNQETETPVYDQNDEVISLAPDNPFGTPLSDTIPVYEQPLDIEDKPDLSMDINEQFGAPVNLDGEDYSFSSPNLSSAFNDELANELANLDILKNDTPTDNKNIEDISLDELLE